MSSRTTKILKLFGIVLIPILVIAGSASLLATDQYLAFEYGKVSFPLDSFGYTPRQRFILASTNIHYIRAHLPADELSKQRLNGIPVYNSREVIHMVDVRAAFQWVSLVWWLVFSLLLLVGLVLWKTGKQGSFASAIQSGGLFTSGIILTIALLAIFAWPFWFSTFHLFFFKPGSWLFSYSDTLIRLFPVEFWFDATMTVSAFSLLGGLLLTLIGWRWRKAQGS